ncbi:MAG: 4-alpha-glucanotransferase [Bacteroidales bacterium]|nr:4-alpha-glucanotransferase [Bacteroidales bacterium]
MVITLRINYLTCYGQQLMVDSIPGMGIAAMEPKQNGDWELTFETNKLVEKGFKYRYLMRDNNVGTTLYEYGERDFRMPSLKCEGVLVRDYWKPAVSPSNVGNTSAFKDVIFKRVPDTEVSTIGNIDSDGPAMLPVRLSIPLSRVLSNHYVAVKFLGSLAEDNIVKPLADADFPMWQCEIAVEKPRKYAEYKYCICEKGTNKIILEEYVTRYFTPEDDKDFYILNDEDFKFPRYPWKGAGVAVPVFSLRSQKGLGVGEFADLIDLIDWAKQVGMRMIQILPVNDTVLYHNYRDSYPYKCVSVFALHPLYMRIQDMSENLNQVAKDLMDERMQELNRLEKIDYEEVMRLKSRLFKIIYDDNKREFLNDKNYQEFYKANEHWLKPYAVFSYLRDLYNTPDFHKWGQYATYSQQMVDDLCREDKSGFDDVAVHFFIQYHLHLQLKKVSDYARANGIVIKGDIPIGIASHSVDAWVDPRLYNLDCQAGAPPDDFSDDGQNWGFPTYNWDEMAKDGFAWWKARLTKMAEYFDAYRLDHILGFFRIWSVPSSQTRGLMGVFDPAIPVKRQEFENRGVQFSEQRFCRPYIAEQNMRDIFKDSFGYVKHQFFNEIPGQPGMFEFKPNVDTQAKIEEAFRTMACPNAEEMLHMQKLKHGLVYLVSEVLFFKDKKDPDGYHPRHSLFKTNSYKALDDYTKQVVADLYNDYFYHRNEELWKQQAEIKLPGLTNATNMMVCGEDLGMIPACVPEVMRKLNILSLEIQRMPKETSVEFGRPASYPFLAVATPSSHDTLPIRGWWEEDPARTQRFYNNGLGKSGQAPFYCETWVVKDIINQHLYSPAMWAVFPIQDILGLSEQYRSNDPRSERVNVPSEANHYWRYRCHVSLETLKEADSLNQLIREMLHYSGRDIAY